MAEDGEPWGRGVGGEGREVYAQPGRKAKGILGQEMQESG